MGLAVHRGYVEDLAAESPGSFGAVTCFEVIEHVPNPVELLRTMRSMLAPGRFLIVSVPNAGDPYCLKQPWPSSMPPVHSNFFNRRSLAAALRRAGLAPIRLRSRLVPTTTVRNLHGMGGFLVRFPGLLGLRLMGRIDGSGLLALPEPGR